MAFITKPKRRNSEKRKEKSRDAARNRRGKEMKVFAELGNYLPVSDETLSQLDKATVMRVAISHLKLRKLCIGEEINSNPKNEESLLMDPLYLKAMEGFLMILGDEGDLTYVSENVSKFLGLQQLDLIGQNIYEFSHPCDHDEMKEVISEHVVKKEGENSPIKHFFMRLKCTLTSKGRNVNLKSATYKVIKCTGKSVTIPADALSHMGDNNPMRVMLIIGEPIPHPSNIETPLDGQTFVSRHSMDMSFTCCDDRVYDLIGYRPSNLIGMSLYDFHHALDSEEVDRAYKTLFAKGQTMTEPYRFLACGGGYAWMQTQATVIYNTRTEKPQCVVCVHFVVSGVEQEDMILSGVQEPQDNESMETDTVPESPDELTFNTESIFAPLTKEKEQDFFRQTELQNMPINSLFDEDVDLTHLAPAAGNVMVPLMVPSQDPLVGKMNMLDDYLFSNIDYCNSSPSTSSSSSASNTTPPVVTKQNAFNNQLKLPIFNAEETKVVNSPKATNARNVNAPHELAVTEKLTNIEEIDIDMRAPYIPMSGEEDLLFSMTSPVPLIDDFDCGQSKMLGTTESVFNPLPEETVDEEKDQIPMDILRQQALNTKEKEMSRIRHIDTAMFKRTPSTETNRLETGPPQKKMRYIIGACAPKPAPCATYTPSGNPAAKVIPITNSAPCGSSVLMNLLTSGEDQTNGYTVKPKTRHIVKPASPPPSTHGTPSGKLSATLRNLLTNPDLKSKLEQQSTSSPPPAAAASERNVQQPKVTSTIPERAIPNIIISPAFLRAIGINTHSHIKIISGNQ